MKPAAPVRHVCRPVAAKSRVGKLVEWLVGQLLAPIAVVATLSTLFAMRPQFIGLRRRGVIAGGAGEVIPVPERAESYWLASDYHGGCGTWVKDWTGHGHHLKIGSAARAEVVGGLLRMPGSGTSSYVATPDHASLDVTGDIELQWFGLGDNLAAGFPGVLISKWYETGNQRSYELSITTTQLLRLSISSTGADVLTADSTVTTASLVSNGQLVGFRATRVVATGAVNFEYSVDDGETWLPFGAQVTLSAGSSIFAGTAELRLGINQSGANPFGGATRRATVKNGIGGTTVFDADFSTLGDGTPRFLEATGKLVTIYPIRGAVVDGALVQTGDQSQRALVAYTPDMNVTGDIDVRWFGQFHALGLDMNLVHRFQTFGETQRTGFRFEVDGANQINVDFGWGGNTENTGISNAHGVPLYTDTWLRFTRVQATGVVRYWKSSDGTNWTEITGSDTINVGAPIGSNRLQLGIGSAVDSASPLRGKTYRVIIKDGIDGTSVVDIDFSAFDDGEGTLYPTLRGGRQFRLHPLDTVTTGDDTNDPKWLPYSADPLSPKAKGLHLPGVSGNYAAIPDAAAVDIVGDITLDADVLLDDWTPSAVSSLISKDDNFDTAKSYRLQISTGGFPQLLWYPLATDASLITATATLALPVFDGQRVRVRASLDVDGNDGGLGWRVKFFYTLDDGVTWVPLGADVTGGVAATSIASTSAQVTFGSRSTTGLFAVGRLFRMRIYNGYFDGTTQGGSEVVDVDFADAAEPYASFAANTGQTVTIARTATGRKSTVVDRPMFLLGSDDYFECPNHAALNFTQSQSLSIALACRHMTWSSGTTQAMMAKKAGAGTGNVGYAMSKSTTPNRLSTAWSDGTNGPNPLVDLAGKDGLALVSAMVRNVAADTGVAYLDGTAGTPVTDTTTGTLTNAEVLRFGRFSASGTSYSDYEWFGGGVWREALSPADITALDTEFATAA